jgi:hypothetical protein
MASSGSREWGHVDLKEDAVRLAMGVMGGGAGADARVMLFLLNA